jgi:hypothetical protein
MTAQQDKQDGMPINLILPDQTIVLLWIVTAEAVRNYAYDDTEKAEYETLSLDACILQKQAGFLPFLKGSTFELEGNAYVVDDFKDSDLKPIANLLRRIRIEAICFFPE